MSFIADEPIPLSALNHWSYCPRRCYLIHAEAEFADNVYTARGQAEHQRVDTIRHEISGEQRAETALPVWSDRLGLIGKCDVVEFLADGSPFPVEYKHGTKKVWDNDDLQVAAQALCLEEMTGKPVRSGAIYHFSSRRRRKVLIEAALRQQVVRAIVAIREVFSSGKAPPPVNDKRCEHCSLKEICQPAAVANLAAISEARRTLFEPEA